MFTPPTVIKTRVSPKRAYFNRRVTPKRTIKPG